MAARSWLRWAASLPAARRSLRPRRYLCSSAEEAILSGLGDLSHRSVLVVGDGDFGFAAALAQMRVCKTLTASTNDSEKLSHKMFEQASSNTSIISAIEGCEVKYELDATSIIRSCGTQKFDTIIWNFPHRVGKQNIKYNRMLLNGFLSSAVQSLSPIGAVKVSLAQGQSGSRAANKVEWDRSWKLTEQAALAGMLISDIRRFDPDRFPGYSPMGHRGHGGVFPQGSAQMFTLQPPGDGVEAVQCAVFTHEVHLVSPHMRADLPSLEASMQSAIRSILQRSLGDLVWAVLLVDVYPTPDGSAMAHAFQVTYGSLHHPVNRDTAERCRDLVERSISSHIDMQIREGKAGLHVSQALGWYCAQGLRSASPTAALPAVQAFFSSGVAAAEISADSLVTIKRQLWRRRAGVLRLAEDRYP